MNECMKEWMHVCHEGPWRLIRYDLGPFPLMSCQLLPGERSDDPDAFPAGPP